MAGGAASVSKLGKLSSFLLSHGVPEVVAKSVATGAVKQYSFPFVVSYAFSGLVNRDEYSPRDLPKLSSLLGGIGKFLDTCKRLSNDQLMTATAYSAVQCVGSFSPEDYAKILSCKHGDTVELGGQRFIVDIRNGSWKPGENIGEFTGDWQSATLTPVSFDDPLGEGPPEIEIFRNGIEGGWFDLSYAIKKLFGKQPFEGGGIDRGRFEFNYDAIDSPIVGRVLKPQEGFADIIKDWWNTASTESWHGANSFQIDADAEEILKQMDINIETATRHSESAYEHEQELERIRKRNELRQSKESEEPTDDESDFDDGWDEYKGSMHQMFENKLSRVLERLILDGDR